MVDSGVPWIGLVALVAMFVIPFIPRWLFEGPRTIKHYPRRHVCADCDTPWIDGHVCGPNYRTGSGPLSAELWRPSTETALERPLWGHAED